MLSNFHYYEAKYLSLKFIKINEDYSNIGDITDCFYSFFLLENKLYSVHRRHLLFSFDNWPKSSSDYTSHIILTCYNNKNTEEIAFEKFLCEGNDPRVVSNGKTAYVLSESTLYSDIPYYSLSILPEGKKISVTLGKGVEKGKNWQPILIENTLYVIDSISPFKLNVLNTDSGLITNTKEIQVDFTLKALHDNYSILRGGSNAICKDGVFYGWGHATTKPYSHVPFIWEYNQDNVITSFVNIHSFFKTNGYNIVDPTSFFEWDDDCFALGVSCSQRDWFHSQWFLNGIILIDKNEFFNKKLSPLIADITKRNVVYFHAAELDTLIDSKYINGGRYNNKKKGCLVCGPSKKIPVDKNYTVELTYSSDNLTTRQVGVFDILLTINGVDKQVAKTKVYGTKGKSSKIKLSFEKYSDIKEALIQTRFFATRRASVTVYYFELTYADE